MVDWKTAGLLVGLVKTKAVFPIFWGETKRTRLATPTGCLPNRSVVGDNGASVAMALSPVPERKTLSGAGSLSVTVKKLAADPATVGVNTMLKVQLWPPGSPPAGPGQVVAEIENGAEI